MMKKLEIITTFFLLNLFLLGTNINAQVSNPIIYQKLLLVNNSGSNGGVFTIDYQIKGTNLTAANTLASLNADITYDSNAIRFVSGTDWHPELNIENGYYYNVKSNPSDTASKRWLRVSIVAPDLNSNGSGQTTGLNVSTQYLTIVRLNFIILDNMKSVTISVENATNQIGFFHNPSNSPNTFEISDQILAPAENINEQPLPVNLASFSADVRGRDVLLEWKTTLEENNSGFDVERKNSDKNNWEKIAFVAGNINKNSLSEYKYSDKKLLTGEYHYRLKQIDLNGNYHYFELSNSIKIGVPGKFAVSQNYPNPFNSRTKIDFELPENSVLSMILFDITGREVRKIINNKEYQSGYYSIDFDAGELPSGTYFYRISADNVQIANKKMILVK